MEITTSSVFSLFYAAPVSYYTLILNKQQGIFDLGEHFRKSTYRNRCNIAGANGLLILSIPLQSRKKKRTPMGEIKISYDHPWRKIHWDSLRAAYRRSPYFEYYEDEFKALYEKKYEKLTDFNLNLHHTILRLTDIPLTMGITKTYIEDTNSMEDFRTYYEKQKRYTTPRYMQVFEDKNGFIEDLSILDLLFNKGNRTKDYLLGITN